MVNTKDYILLMVSLAIGFAITGFLTFLHYPTGIYQVITTLLPVIVFYTWKETTTSEKLVLLSLIWYSMFWVVRDAIMGFYTSAGFCENTFALLPTVVALFHSRFPSSKWWGYLIIIAIHGAMTFFMNETNNELIALLVLSLILNNYVFEKRILLFSLYWYQAYLASTKYILYPNQDLIYLVALTPYVVSLLTIFLKKVLKI